MEVHVYLASIFVCFTVTAARMNVLFLCADDLRPELPMYYGPYFPSPTHPQIHAPNLVKLAEKSLVLKRAYVQQALCSPSRTSLLTGRRPDTTHVYNLDTYWRHVSGNFTTIPQYFKNHGYRSIGVGKIFHAGIATPHHDPLSWTDRYFDAHEARSYMVDGNSWRAVPDNLLTNNHVLQDTLIANHAVQVIKDIAPKAKSGNQNFFLAVGFHKPHLPFQFPARFLDYYPEDSIHLPPNPYAPEEMPHIAWATYGELRSYKDIALLNASGQANTTLPQTIVKQLRRAYYSAVSYMDYELGRVLDELKNQGLADNTIVSFFGDHGWQLGEHGEWCKHTNFDLATHAPMMIHVPGRTDKGLNTTELTEFVDLFPTLVEAAGLPHLQTCKDDSVKTLTCSEGTSLVPLMNNPHLSTWKKAVFSQYPRRSYHKPAMGYTVTTDRYRYTEWVNFLDKPQYKPDWGLLRGVELYDHKTDPQENHNLALHASHHAVRLQLQKQLHDGWRAQLPGNHGGTIIG